MSKYECPSLKENPKKAQPAQEQRMNWYMRERGERENKGAKGRVGWVGQKHGSGGGGSVGRG